MMSIFPSCIRGNWLEYKCDKETRVYSRIEILLSHRHANMHTMKKHMGTMFVMFSLLAC